jgi:hypothetical protein
MNKFIEEIKLLKDELHDDKITKEKFCEEFDRFTRYNSFEEEDKNERIEQLEEVIEEIKQLVENI